MIKIWLRYVIRSGFTTDVMILVGLWLLVVIMPGHAPQLLYMIGFGASGLLILLWALWVVAALKVLASRKGQDHE